MNAPAVSAGGLVTLAWSQGGGGPPTAYTIIARFTTNGPVIASLPVSAGATSISVTAPPGTYFVSVAASNAVGTSAESNQVIVVVP
jgi:hypothetical protein